ncbi:hypothetical protein GHK68_24415 [Sinorhizobium meliloti]|uniref:hypothetical protein n=1 Tax=Rhizobium meliloti TaxID=382 RepID=UPI00129798C1|nr:hypothetical protein [Sinorhizobium meliloti]MQW45318.1 hypothetical protein [Sinorhizobium meliloti]
MTDERPDFIETINALARLLLDNLDRADTDSARTAAAIIDRATTTPELPPHNAENWGRAVALYHAALMEFPPPDYTPEPPADWAATLPPLEAYDDEPGEFEDCGTHDAASNKPRITFEP